MTTQIFQYSNIADACAAIAGSMQKKIADDLLHRDEVSVLVSGGNSPRLILPALAKSGLDFSRINFLSCDERIVAPEHEDSTEGMVVNLFRKEGIAINYTGLGGHTSADRALAYWKDAISRLAPAVSAALLGVGEDGHFSSFFPGRGEIFIRDSLAIPVPETPPHKHDRLTLGLDFILKSELIVMPVFGERKKAVIAQAISVNDVIRTPVSVLFSGNNVPLEIYEV